MRVLGVDLGSVRTGLALSDPHGVTCSPLGVLEEADREVLVKRVLQTAAEAGAELIVVGLPRPLRGGTNSQMKESEDFAAALAGVTALPVRLWDERFTTKLAQAGESGRARRRRGEPPDAAAACHLLQSYLDAECGGREP